MAVQVTKRSGIEYLLQGERPDVDLPADSVTIKPVQVPAPADPLVQYVADQAINCLRGMVKSGGDQQVKLFDLIDKTNIPRMVLMYALTYLADRQVVTLSQEDNKGDLTITIKIP